MTEKSYLREPPDFSKTLPRFFLPPPLLPNSFTLPASLISPVLAVVDRDPNSASKLALVVSADFKLTAVCSWRWRSTAAARSAALRLFEAFFLPIFLPI